ncbi:MAG: hypothetical protein RRZ68_04040 [Oscillospiraceae bacterium]
MKKTISILISVLMLILLFSSCSMPTKAKVNGSKISNGVYAYFLAEAQKEIPDSSESEKKALANSLLCRYVAINSQFLAEKLSLTTAERSVISRNVNSYWHLFEKHYTENGISKQDLLKIEESKIYENMLLTNRYSQNGASPIDETELKKYFSENFIAFKSLTGFLTTVNNNGEAVPLSEIEKANLSKKFESLTAKINDGSPIDEVCANIDNATLSSKVVVINRNSKEYPEGFFDAVYVAENNKAKSFTINDYAFIVYRENIEDEQLNLFSNYKTECLKALKGEEFKKVVDGWTAAYKVD